MTSRRWQFDRDSLYNVDIYTDRHAATETLSQAITAALSEEEPDADGSVQFGQMQGTVVGIRYYTGVVNPGEMVALVREPRNPYDRNAVMVANMFGSQVGHIKRELAAAMAHVMDNNLAKIEGVVHKGTNNAFNMPVLLTFWGKEEHKDVVIERMARHGFRLNLPGTKPTGKGIMTTGPNARGLRAPPRVIIPLSAEELKNAFDNLFEGLMESKDGEKEAAESVCTPLLAHQKQALSWMCACENNTGLPPFWSMKGEFYYNSITCFNTRERPQRVRGGILADDMGLGKTLTTIALILTNFHKGKPLPLEKCEAQSASPQKVHKPDGGSDQQDNAEVKDAAAVSSDHASSQDDVVFVDSSEVVEESAKPQKKKNKGKATKPKARKEAPALHEDVEFMRVLSGSTSDGRSKTKTAAKRPTPNSGVESSITDTEEDLSARATLIICPLSVLSNWLDQFEQHVAPDVKLNVYMYYGSDRNRNKTFLSSQDIVLTTYNVLSADFGNNSPLHGINWLRVVLDEGHVIRNPNAQMSKAVLALKAHRRWILSGTPIQNSVKDLWMLLAFLCLKPFDVKEWWDRVIQRPVAQGNRDGLKNLQTLVKCITLRRTKSSTVNGHPLVSLPEKTVCVEQVEMTPQERNEYETARNEGKTTLNRYVAEGTVMRNYADVLAILMRLRQHCCHPALVAKILKDLGSSATPSELRERLIQKLRLVLASGCDEECSVCLESVHLPVITHCAHVYCRACIARVISAEQDRARCPLCRSDIKTNQLVEVPPEELEEKDEMRSEKWRTSSKVDALMANLLRLRNEDCTIKCLVVSQFTRFLNILETPLREQGFSFVRLDGSMSQKKRAQVIQDFQNPAPDSPVIMLLSLKAGGVGLNLTAASHVFLMDPAWNPAAEEQCIDRCHRLGQKRKVVVTKFIVKDSVEEKMVQIQRQKQDLVEKAFGKKNAEKTTSRIDDIRALMEL